MPPATYVLPLRRWACEPMDELAAYLASLPRDVEVVVVDGSDDAVFAHHARAFGSRVRHERVDPRHACAYGKVAGVHTGVERASNECVVLADDDVRYDAALLDAVLARLRHADLVRPQNAFTTLPWHAWWDTGRTLLNRAVSVDHPGTLAVRRSSFLAVGGYDGDVLFENLELVRTIRAAGGTVVDALDVVVPRLPPTSRQFLAQRVRQAYDSLATPGRLAFELSLAPLAAFVATRRTRVPLLLGAAAGAVAVAERGRRRAGGRAAYPPVTPLAAPVWLCEHGVTSWLAVARRVARGGVRYAGTRLRRAATPERELRARLAGTLGRSGLDRAEPARDVVQVMDRVVHEVPGERRDREAGAVAAPA